jgi:hypothetical protein
MTTTFNTSLVLSYDLARYGATVNDSIVYNEPEDLVYQVTQNFARHYCSASGVATKWNSDTSLFALWFGINEFVYLISRALTA